MSSRAVEAGRAFVKLVYGDDEVKAGLAKTSAELARFGARMRNVGLALSLGVGAPLAAFVRTFSNLGSELTDLSGRTGIAAESLSILQYATNQTGASMSNVQTAVVKMQRAISDANAGTAGAGEVFDRIGVSLASLAGLSVDEQFSKIAEAISQISNAADQTAALSSIFGRGGVALRPLLKDFEALTARARELGLEISGESAAAADQFGDTLGDLSAVVSRTAFELGAALAPTLGQFVEMAVNAANGLLQFVKANEGTVQVVLVAGAGVAALGAALAVVGTTINVVGGSLTGLALAIRGVASAAAFLTATPIGAALAAIGVVVAGLTYAWTQHRSEIAKVEDAYRGLAGGQSLGVNATQDELVQFLAARNQEIDKQIEILEANIAELKKPYISESGIDYSPESVQGQVGKLEQVLGQLRSEKGRNRLDINDIRTAQESETEEEITAARQQEIEDRKKAQLTADQELAEIRIRLAQDGMAEELTLLDLKFQREAAAMREQGVTAERIAELRAAKEAEIRQQYAEKEAEERQRLAEQEAQQLERERAAQAEAASRAVLSQADALAEVRVQRDFSGVDEERELLKLREQQALRDAVGGEAERQLIRERFAIEQQLLDKRDREGKSGSDIAARRTPEVASLGAFASSAISGFFGRGSDNSAREQLVENRKQTALLGAIAKVVGNIRPNPQAPSIIGI